MKAIAMFLVLLFVGVVADMNAFSAYAAEGYRWTNGSSSVLQSFAKNPDSNKCSGYQQDMRISELRRSQKVCVFGDERLRIGYFSDGGPYRGVVGFPYSSEMHLLEGVCNDTPCRYSADQDMLVTQQPVGYLGWGVIVFRHASERIKRMPSTTSPYKYVFDASSPDYAVTNASGDLLVTPSYAISNNGKWIVVELREKGFAIINTDTFDSRQVTTVGSRYGIGFDPSQQLAVSDDGKGVAAAGLNAGFAVIDVLSGCGQELVGDLSRQIGTVDCPSNDAGIINIFPDFRSAWQPRFFGDGQQLEVTVVSMFSPTQRVSLLASGANPVRKLKLLALGDSFTSGEGETDSSYYVVGTNSQFDTCHVSKRSYPLLVAASVGISTSDAKSVACSGAKIEDIVSPIEAYWGQSKRLGNDGLKLSLEQKTIAQEEAVGSFQPGRTLQSAFLQRYMPEVVIVGIGGNDAGLMSKLKACAMPGTCEWAKGEGLKQTAGEIRRLHDKFVTMLLHISQQSLGARVYAVGYPDFIELEGSCDPVTGLLIDQAERRYINESISYLNLVIRAASREAGATYVDIQDSFGDNKLCGPRQTAMNGLRLGGDIAIIPILPMMKIIGAETFHPTPDGHALIANRISSRYQSLGVEMTCAKDPGFCGQVSYEPSSYWGTNTGEADRDAYAVDFVNFQSQTKNGIAIETAEGIFESGSRVEVEIRSEPIRLGELSVDAEGSVSGMVSIPNSIESGFHTLHLLGTNNEGKAIDAYQIIEVVKDDEGITTINTADNSSSNHTIRLPFALDTVDVRVIDGSADILGVQNVVSAAPSMIAPQSKAQLPLREQTSIGWYLAIAIAGIAFLLFIVGALLIRRWAKSRS